MSNTPDKRPAVEGIEARAKKAQCYSGYCFGLLGGSPFEDIPALIAWIEKLEAVVEAARHVNDEMAVEASGADVGGADDTSRWLEDIRRPIAKALAALGDGDG